MIVLWPLLFQIEKQLQEGLEAGARHGPKQHTLLQTASMHGQLRIVKLLLRSKANINDINLEGNTAAHVAFQFKYVEVSKMYA